MTDSDDKNVKRYGRRNQKEQLSRPDSVFPPDADTEFDIDSLPLPDTDSEALQSLAALSDEVKAPLITPEEERFPPLAPRTAKEASAPQEIEASEDDPAHNTLYNILTVLLLFATIAFIAWAVVIWNDPQSLWNPLPPSTPFVVVTATPGDPFIGITSTPDESGQIFVVITDTPPPQLDPASAYPFLAQQSYLANTNDMGCNWWSIAGTVTDTTGNGLTGYRVRILGEGFDETIFSGTAPTFGDGGFEFPLTGAPQVANFTVQLFSPQNTELSESINFSTRIDCEVNVAYLNFVGNP